MPLSKKENSKKIGLSIIVLIAVVLFIGSLKMLADNSVILDISVVAPTTPSTPSIPGVPTTPPTTPTVPELPPGVLEEIKQLVAKPVVPQKPVTPQIPSGSHYTLQTITDVGEVNEVVVTSLGYRLVLALLAAFILANLLLLFIFYRPRKKSMVYDSKTKDPIEGAKVELLDKNGKTLQSTLSNEQGIFEFDLEAIKHFNSNSDIIFYLEATKKGYLFPSKKLKGESKDDDRGNLYFGVRLETKKKDNINQLGINIPMDPIKKR